MCAAAGKRCRNLCHTKLSQHDPFRVKDPCSVYITCPRQIIVVPLSFNNIWHLFTFRLLRWEAEGADQLQWSSCAKVTRCFCITQLLCSELSICRCSVCLSELWVISCHSSSRNYTWCLSKLSLFFFHLAACATSKSYLILSTHWLTFLAEVLGSWTIALSF